MSRTEWRRLAVLAAVFVALAFVFGGLGGMLVAALIRT